MNLSISTHPCYGFFFPTDSGATRRTIVKPDNTKALGTLHQLPKNATLVISQPARTEVICLEGTLWITHDGCSKDIVLETGERYVASSAARMLVHALSCSQLRLVGSAQPESGTVVNTVRST